MVSSTLYCHFRCVWPSMPKLIKIISLLFLCNIVRKKYISDEVDFLHADKHESMLQIDIMILMGMVKHSQSSQKSKFVCLYNISKKKLEMKLNFCMQINIKCLYKLISILLALKSPRRWYYHYWWEWWSILKALKVTSLQYLYYPKKKLGMEFIFCMQQNLIFFKWKWLDMFKVPKTGSW